MTACICVDKTKGHKQEMCICAGTKTKFIMNNSLTKIAIAGSYSRPSEAKFTEGAAHSILRGKKQVLS